MDLESLRDWVIIIFGILGIGAILLFISLAIIFFCKVNPILNSIKRIFGSLRSTPSLIEPIVRLTSLVSEIHKTWKMLSRFLGRRGEGGESE